MNRDFYKWIETFTGTLRDCNYWVDWNKIMQNVEKYKDEFNILNGLIGAKNIENELIRILNKYPNVIKCIPTLLAIRETEINLSDQIVKFNSRDYDTKQICWFLKEAGLLWMFANRKIKNVLDYVTGVEVGLDTNARKNRGGKMMSKLFEHFLNESKIKFYKETKLKNIPNLNIPDNIKNKQFDFVFLINDIVYGVEVNFYSGGGSKLNETAKSYVELNNEFKKIPNFKFLWITDGAGWKSAKNDLKLAFKNIEHLYNINNLKNGILNKLTDFKQDVYDEIDALADEDATLNSL